MCCSEIKIKSEQGSLDEVTRRSLVTDGHFDVVGLKPESLVLEYTGGLELEAVNGVERGEVEARAGTEGSRDRVLRDQRFSWSLRLCTSSSRSYGFDPLLDKQDPPCCAAKKKKKKRGITTLFIHSVCGQRRQRTCIHMRVPWQILEVGVCRR